MPTRSPSGRVRAVAVALRFLLAFAFTAAGIAKLAGLPMMVQVFDHVGFGQWFRYVTGAIEVGGAVLLFTSRFVGLAGLVLACTMVGATIAHLTVVPGSPVPAIILLALSATVAFVYRDRTLALFGATPTPQVA